METLSKRLFFIVLKKSLFELNYLQKESSNELFSLLKSLRKLVPVNLETLELTHCRPNQLTGLMGRWWEHYLLIR